MDTSRLNKAKVKNNTKRNSNTYGEQVGILRIDERARDIKNSTDTYPTFDELLESFHDELTGKSKVTEKKKYKYKKILKKQRHK